MTLEPFEFPEEFSIENLQRRLRIIRDTGFISIIGKKRSSDVGESLEFYLGLDKNNLKTSDWGDYEIKTTSRKKITLLSFSWQFYDDFTPSKLVRVFGKKHFSKHMQEPVIRLDWAINYLEDPIQELYYTIKDDRIILMSDQNALAYYALENLRKRFYKKFRKLVLVSVEKRIEDNQKVFRLNNITLFEEPSFETFLKLLMKNEIKFEFALMIHKLQTAKPKLKNRGTLIRANISSITKIYKLEKTI